MPKKHAKNGNHKKVPKINLKLNQKNVMVFVLVVVVIVAGYFALQGGGKSTGQAGLPVSGTQNVFLQTRGIADPTKVVAFAEYFEGPAVRALAAPQAAMPATSTAGWGDYDGVCFKGECYAWLSIVGAYVGSREADGWTMEKFWNNANMQNEAVSILVPAITMGIDNGNFKLCKVGGKQCDTWCFDSDGGAEYGTFGYAEDYKGKKLDDECTGTAQKGYTSVYERYCNRETETAATTIPPYKCGEDSGGLYTYCWKGKCVYDPSGPSDGDGGNGDDGEPGTACDDSADGGMYPNIPGITEYQGKANADYCWEQTRDIGGGKTVLEQWLHEYSCDSKSGKLNETDAACEGVNYGCCDMEITEGKYNGKKAGACGCAE